MPSQKMMDVDSWCAGAAERQQQAAVSRQQLP
jgi:hypothetical protein